MKKPVPSRSGSDEEQQQACPCPARFIADLAFSSRAIPRHQATDQQEDANNKGGSNRSDGPIAGAEADLKAEDDENLVAQALFNLAHDARDQEAIGDDYKDPEEEEGEDDDDEEEARGSKRARLPSRGRSNGARGGRSGRGGASTSHRGKARGGGRRPGRRPISEDTEEESDPEPVARQPKRANHQRAASDGKEEESGGKTYPNGIKDDHPQHPNRHVSTSEGGGGGHKDALGQRKGGGQVHPGKAPLFHLHQNGNGNPMHLNLNPQRPSIESMTSLFGPLVMPGGGGGLGGLVGGPRGGLMDPLMAQQIAQQQLLFQQHQQMQLAGLGGMMQLNPGLMMAGPHGVGSLGINPLMQASLPSSTSLPSPSQPQPSPSQPTQPPGALGAQPDQTLKQGGGGAGDAGGAAPPLGLGGLGAGLMGLQSWQQQHQAAAPPLPSALMMSLMNQMMMGQAVAAASVSAGGGGFSLQQQQAIMAQVMGQQNKAVLHAALATAGVPSSLLTGSAAAGPLSRLSDAPQAGEGGKNGRQNGSSGAMADDSLRASIHVRIARSIQSSKGEKGEKKEDKGAVVVVDLSCQGGVSPAAAADDQAVKEKLKEAMDVDQQQPLPPAAVVKSEEAVACT